MTTSAEVPANYPVAINGVAYLLDTRGGRGMKRRSVPWLKRQSDQAPQTGGPSLSPEGAWRRSMEDWAGGAGQSNWDRDSSNPARFRSSKGVDPWTRWQLGLLNDTANKRATAATNLRTLRAGGYLYVADGTTLVHTTDITTASPTWTDATIQNGEAATTITDITTNGSVVYAGLGVNGIHQTTAGAAVSTHYNALAADLVDYTKGRLMAAAGNAIYNVTASGAAPTALFSHPSGTFTWVGFAGGYRGIYAAGYTGTHTEVYRINIKADGTGLDAPVIAGELPNGEYCESIESYLGYVLLGTTAGVRFCQVDGSGDLVVGSLIPTTSSVRCFESQGQYVWFGMTDYDATSSGLGRMDLATFTSPGTPAYASDLMATGQGIVFGASTFQSRRIFAVRTVGIFAESAVKVATGTLDSGVMSFGIGDPKVALELDVRHKPLVGTHAGSLAVDSGAFVSLGSHTTQGESASTPFGANEARGDAFEVRLTLGRFDATDAVGPTITRSTLLAFPAPRRAGEHIVVDLLLFDDTVVVDSAVSRDPRADFNALLALEMAGTVVDFQMGGATYRVMVDDHEWIGEKVSGSRDWWRGTMTVDLRVMA